MQVYFDFFKLKLQSFSLGLGGNELITKLHNLYIVISVVVGKICLCNASFQDLTKSISISYWPYTPMFLRNNYERKDKTLPKAEKMLTC